MIIKALIDIFSVILLVYLIVFFLSIAIILLIQIMGDEADV